MNPWEEFQQYQQPAASGLGQTLAGGPSQQQAQGAMPPSSPEEYQQRVQGWTGALQELVQNPGVAAMLIQMGTNLGSGMSGPRSIAGGFGAMGRVGEIQNELGQQQLKNRAAEQAMDLENRKFGLEERKLSAQEKMWEAQMKNYERLARGGGGGGRLGTGEQQKAWEERYAWRLARNLQSGMGRDEAVREATDFADSSVFGNSRVPREEKFVETPLARYYRGMMENIDPVMEPEKWNAAAEAYKNELLRSGGQAGVGGAMPSPGGPMSSKDEAIARLKAGGFGQGASQQAAPATPAAVPPPPPTPPAPLPNPYEVKELPGVVRGPQNLVELWELMNRKPPPSPGPYDGVILNRPK